MQTLKEKLITGGKRFQYGLILLRKWGRILLVRQIPNIRSFLFQLDQWLSIRTGNNAITVEIKGNREQLVFLKGTFTNYDSFVSLFDLIYVNQQAADFLDSVIIQLVKTYPSKIVIENVQNQEVK